MESGILSTKEIRRYQKHIALPEIGTQGQEKLKNAKVIVIGAGGLGAPILQYLTAAGIGEIGIVDNDKVSEENLQRQILYGASDIGKLKTIIAKTRLESQNEMVKFNIHNIRFSGSNGLDLIRKYDLVIDATDNIPSRLLINDACVIENKPMIHGAIYKYEGHVSVFNYKGGPTFRCLYSSEKEIDKVPNPENLGILGVLPGIIGSLQAAEAIKIITGIGKVLSGKLLTYNMLNISINFFKIPVIKENHNINNLS